MCKKAVFNLTMSSKDIDLSNITAELRFLKIERFRGFY